MQSELMRPIAGIENRTAQEVFDIMCDRFKIALSAAEPVASVIAERDALIAAGLKCCDGTPNPDLRPFDLAMSFIDSTNTARKAADMLWQEYKAELDAIRAAPPAPSVAVKASKSDLDKVAEDRWAAYPWSVASNDEGQIENVKRAYLIAFKAGFYASQAALSAQVQDVTEVSPSEYMRRHDAAIAAYEANTPNDYRYSALALRKAVDAAFAIAAAPAKQEGGE